MVANYNEYGGTGYIHLEGEYDFSPESTVKTVYQELCKRSEAVGGLTVLDKDEKYIQVYHWDFTFKLFYESLNGTVKRIKTYLADSEKLIDNKTVEELKDEHEEIAKKYGENYHCVGIVPHQEG